MGITMKSLNDRISVLEGKVSTTPITMKGLSDRLDNIEATAKQWEIVDIPCSWISNTDYINGAIPSKYANMNYVFHSINIRNASGSTSSLNTSNINANLSFSKSGNTITIRGMGKMYGNANGQLGVLKYSILL